MAETQRAQLIKSRRSLRGLTTRHVNAIRKIIADDTVEGPQKLHVLRQRQSELIQTMKRVEQVDQEIYDTITDDEELETLVDESEQINNVNRGARDEISFHIKSLEEQGRTEVQNQTDELQNDPTSRVASTRANHRPKIQLPRFNGEILKWQPFWQAFEAEIHSDRHTANINKFNYLMGLLEPNVASAVAGLVPSNDSYPELVKLLEGRYGSKSKITMAYMRALCGLAKPENTHKSLRTFFDLLESYVRGLESLGKASDTYGELLVCILLDKLPGELRRNLTRKHDQDEWSLQKLRDVLRSEIRALEAGQVSTIPQHFFKTPNQAASLNNSATKFSCPFCKGEHFPGQCTKYQTTEERMKIVTKNRLCANCLHSKHQVDVCFSKKRCRVCKGKHHTTLHELKPQTVTTALTATAVCLEQHSSVSLLSASTQIEYSDNFTVLKSAIVPVASLKGLISANVVVDEGSQRTLMNKKLAKQVKVKKYSQEFLILVGSTGLTSGPRLYDVIEFTLFDRNQNPMFLKAIVVEQAAKPLDDTHRKRINSLPHLEGLDMAHPTLESETFNIDLLIGADFYWSIIEDETPIRGEGPVAVRSRIGYLVSGPLQGNDGARTEDITSLHITVLEEMDVSCLWSLESLGIYPQTENIEEATEYAKENIKFQNGKYVARLPWRKEHPELPTNSGMIKNMTRAIIRRLAKDPTLFKFFGNLIVDQLKRGFIEKVPMIEMQRPCHYIPYHYVKKSSSTTPIRIVYNCSCRAVNGTCLNDCVQTGAILQNDQIGIILRFRSHRIGLVADVEKAFHHIGLNEADRDFLRWFWIDDPNNPESNLVAYRFKVVPFGAKSSPFILNSTVLHHLKQESSRIAKDMQENIYVDNIISGCESTEEAMDYYHKANEIMERAGLPLQAWGFSDQLIEETIKKDSRLDINNTSKTLGLIWDRSKDVLSVQSINMLSFCSVSATHKDVLRGTHSLYDPLGLYSPLSVKGKILLQDLNREKIPFDQELSEPQRQRWMEIASDIFIAVEQRIMSITRSFVSVPLDKCELHVFGDASKRAYGAVAYLVKNEHVSFVMAKSKVNPKKEENRDGEREVSIPEAELLAAHIGTLLVDTIVAALEPTGIRPQIFLWSDSQIVLFWISKPENHPRPFVTNRVKKIREATRLKAATWKYVTTDQNPADILSRGASLKEFKSSKIWEKGPSWQTEKRSWPVWSVSSFKSCQVLLTQQPAATTSEPNILSIIDPAKYKWTILLRMTAMILRLQQNLKLKDRSRLTWNRERITAPELFNAKRIWICVFQKKHLAEELNYLQSKKKSWRPALVAKLDLFLDTHGLIRCGGRFGNSTMSESAKHPLLIPKNSVLAKLIITSVHERIFHLRVDQTLSNLQQQYWIPAFRQQVAAVIHHCTKCRRYSGPSYQLPDPAPLPAARVRDSYPFSILGLDYTGAINIKIKGTKELAQAYILLMTCGYTRGVHLEVVGDMSTESFLKGFRRYTGHHRLPRLIISDNATTFITASDYLTKLFKDHQVTSFLSDRNIQWKFIPKRAPWYGGFWERLVGMAKTVLNKMVGNIKLTLEELQTAVCEIEAILNDRKLTNIPSEIGDLAPLTPSHLIYGERLCIFPDDLAMEEKIEDPTYGESASVISKSYWRIQTVKKSFIRMWNNVYLPSLREHHQKTRGPINEVIKMGDVVQIHNEGKRSSWKLAVVEGLIKGADGKVRAADVRTANGKTNRPVTSYIHWN